jgi:transcription-repair coupling factor (superfamily II helicase)
VLGGRPIDGVALLEWARTVIDAVVDPVIDPVQPPVQQKVESS